MVKQASKKRLLINILVLVVTCMVLFLVLEVLFRAAIKNEPSILIFNNSTGTRHVSGSFWVCHSEFCNEYVTNKEGFFSREFSVEPTEKRVFIMGDSFMAAAEVPMLNATPSLLERNLQKVDENYVVYNFGTGGHGPDQYLTRLEEYAPQYPPTIVIFSIYVGNDLRNINPLIEQSACKPYLNEINGRLVAQWTGDVPLICKNSLLKSIIKQSRFASYLSVNLINFVGKSKLNGTSINPVDLAVYKINDSTYDSSYELLDKILIQARDDASRWNATFIVMTIPSAEHVNKTLLKEESESFNWQVDQFDTDIPFAQINTICKKENLLCVHLNDTFAEKSKNTSNLFYPENKHFTPHGHEVTSQTVFRFLVERNIISSSYTD